MRLAGFSIAVVVGLAAVTACTLELDRTIACGDGYVDRLAGEECDPLDPASYEDACREHNAGKPEGPGGCDPQTCSFDFSQCARCGDGQLDAGEECDGNAFGDRTCPGDQPGLRCTFDCRIDESQCPSCGNGVKDEGEECDFNDGGGFVMPRLCAGTEDILPLASPNPHYPYAFGETTRCEQDCRYDRRACSYCGNGRLDDEVLIDDVQQRFSLAEVCDGELFDDAQLMAQFGSFCYQMEGIDLRPNVGCENNCLRFVLRPDDPDCCVKKGDRCPAPTDPFQCCFAYDHPEAEPCQTVFDNMGLARDVCN